MSDWTIKGEAGKSFTDTLIDVDALAMQNGSLTFTNQGNDSLSFLLLSDDHTTDPLNLPDKDQEISIYRGGVRQFFGYVTVPKYVWSPGQSGWIIQAENGWRELDRVPLTDADKEYVRAQGSLAATITDVINKAIAGGARLQLGSIAAMFEIPPIAFRGVNCGAALIELLRIVSDAVAYLDHTGTGFPTLNIVRRGAMTTKTITIGTDEIDTCQVEPIPEVTPTKVTVAYATRDANGVVTEYVQTAGSGSDAQAVILTEPNFSQFTAKAAAEQVAMQTITTATAAFAVARAPNLRDIVGLPAPTASGNYTIPNGGTYTTKGSVLVSGTSPAFSGFTAPNVNALLTGEIKDFMLSRLAITEGVCTYKATLWWKFQNEDASGPVDPPDWAAPLIAAGGFLRPLDWWNTGTGGANVQSNPNTWTASNIMLYVEFQAPAISRAFTSLTNVRDPGNYGTTAPPATLATDLLAAQNWLPHRGRLNFTPWHPYERLLAKKIDLAGTNPRLAGIGATVQSETVNIQTGVQETQLGLPARGGGAALARLKVLSST